MLLILAKWTHLDVAALSRKEDCAKNHFSDIFGLDNPWQSFIGKIQMNKMNLIELLQPEKTCSLQICEPRSMNKAFYGKLFPPILNSFPFPSVLCRFEWGEAYWRASIGIPLKWKPLMRTLSDRKNFFVQNLKTAFGNIILRHLSGRVGFSKYFRKCPK